MPSGFRFLKLNEIYKVKGCARVYDFGPFSIFSLLRKFENCVKI